MRTNTSLKQICSIGINHSGPVSHRICSIDINHGGPISQSLVHQYISNEDGNDIQSASGREKPRTTSFMALSVQSYVWHGENSENTLIMYQKILEHQHPAERRISFATWHLLISLQNKCLAGRNCRQFLPAGNLFVFLEFFILFY